MKTKTFLALGVALGAAICWFHIATKPGVDPGQPPPVAASIEINPASAPPVAAGIHRLDTPSSAESSGAADSAAASAAKPSANGPGHSSSVDRWQFATAWGRETNQSLRAFSAWGERYLAAASPETKEALVAEGVELAVRRQPFVREMIVNDPAAALAHTVPARIRQQLPESVATHLEERVSGRGDFSVLAAVPAKDPVPGFRPIERRVEVKGRSFRAHAFGRRTNMKTRHGISLHGIALDGEMAVSDSPLRLLEPGESPDPAKLAEDRRCPVSRFESAESATVAESATRTYWLCRGGHIEALDATVSATEGVDAAAAYQSLGAKRVLVMLVDFPDRPGGPVSGGVAGATMSRVNEFFRANAFGQMWFSDVAITPLLRMPQTTPYYLDTVRDGPRQLLLDARAAATAAGYTEANYQFDVVAVTDIGFRWGGLGYVGTKGAWVQGSLDAGIAAHELGHNVGLWHAGFWTAPDGLGFNGTREEYGNIFDVMGNSGSFPSGHFSANFKHQLGWLPENFIHTSTAPNTYRIYAMDAGGALRADRRYALRIPAGVSVLGLSLDYWIDYRWALPAAGSGVEGATVQWGSVESAREASLLVDTTPGSRGGKTDATVAVGDSFLDSARQVQFTVVGRGGTGADAYLDVHLGPPPPPISLTDALDLEGAHWTTSGNAGWLGQVGTGHDGTDVARSGSLGDGQTSSIETTLTGAGTLTFWWKVSSEQRFDFLKLFIDGQEVEKISGDVDWRQRTHTLGAGTHTVRWVYSKDASLSSSLDRGWLDEVTFSGIVGAGVYVDGRYTGSRSDGSLARPFKTVASGTDAVPTCGTVRIRAGSYPGPLLLAKCMKLEAYGGTVVLGSPASREIASQPTAGLSTPVRKPDGTIAVGFSGEVGRQYGILVSTNLVSWEPWKSFEADEAAFELIDSGASSAPHRFFKLVPQ